MEAVMVDRSEIETIVADCERYWRSTGIARRTAAEMRQELESHLTEAALAGRPPREVIGDDLAGFARDWAAEQRPGSAEKLPAWEEVFTKRRRFGTFNAVMILAAVAIIVIALLTRGQGGNNSMDNEIWRWIWLAAAVVFGVGEMLTAGFFMLPFSVGAVGAMVLAWFDVDATIQMIVFLALSGLALLFLRSLIRKAPEHQLPVGANRFMNQTAIVIDAIDRTTGAGRVRVDTELWRATTDGDPIPEGTEVRITDVRGTRLVVEPED
jgi:membrane protein implicated in regulation of membrane protease activity